MSARCWRFAAALALGLPLAAAAQTTFVPGPTSYGSAEWRESVASVATLPACDGTEASLGAATWQQLDGGGAC